MLENYSPQIQNFLKKNKIEISDRIAVGGYEGILMPKSAGDPDTLVLKLDNGYNIGIAFSGKIKKLKSKGKKEKIRLKEYKPDPGKKTIAMIHTGGTIASRVDYRTGAVFPAFTAEDLFLSTPELAAIANFRTRVAFQMFSEDMEPMHWIILAEKISEEISFGCDGIIIVHGTDTMAYTAAALSYMLQNLSIPVLIVGAQRSSDRGSSDAAMNLICAASFIAKTDFAGVAVCMHGSIDDDYCFALPAANVKKMHTSRRDTFRSIDVLPYAKVHCSGEIEFLRDYSRRSDKQLVVKNKFDTRVAIVKSRPGFSYRELELFEKAGYKGIIIEGTGLGHVPVTALDKYTQHHKNLLTTIARMTKKGIFVGMVSQCPYGRVNMNVYSTGRDLQKAGVVPLTMTTEAAYVKLGWALATAGKERIKEIMLTNIAGEIVERIDPRAFLY